MFSTLCDTSSARFITITKAQRSVLPFDLAEQMCLTEYRTQLCTKLVIGCPCIALCVQIRFKKFIQKSSEVVRTMASNSFHTVTLDVLELDVVTLGPGDVEVQVCNEEKISAVCLSCSCLVSCQKVPLLCHD